MAYDQELARRIREHLAGTPGLSEKKMFGGVGYLVQGNMACGVTGESLIVRVGPEGYTQALEQPHARPFDMTGRPMSGWVMVAPAGYQADQDLSDWVGKGVEFARSLPPK